MAVPGYTKTTDAVGRTVNTCDACGVAVTRSSLRLHRDNCPLPTAEPSLSASEIARLRATWTETHGTFMDAVDDALAAKRAEPEGDWLAVCDALRDDFMARGRTEEEAKAALVRAVKADVKRGFLGGGTLEAALKSVAAFDEWYGIRTVRLDDAPRGVWRNWELAK